MGNTGPTKVLLNILNVLYVILALALAAGSVWFFVEVINFTSLRNRNHYLLDYNVYWPQAIPWMFIVVGVFALCVTCCGFSGSKKNNRALIVIYVIFQVIAVVLLIAAAVIALVFADSKATEDFVKDTVWDGYLQTKSEPEIAESFGRIEKRLQCCGAEGPRDYKVWKNEFPMSCCDVYYHGWIPQPIINCEITNQLANERHGCSIVATQYARIAIKVLSGTSVFTAFIGIISLIVAMTLSRALKQKPRLQPQHESESKKSSNISVRDLRLNLQGPMMRVRPVKFSLSIE